VAAILLALWLLLGGGAVVRADEIHDAARDGKLERVQELVKANPALVSSKDKMGGTPLHWAAFKGQQEVAEFLLANRAEVNAKANGGLTPLHLAAGGNHKEMAELLLSKGGEVNARDDHGNTALDLGANGSKELIELLLSKGAEVNAKNAYGISPLLVALQGGHLEVVELLLAHGAELNIKDDHDQTAMHYGVGSGNRALVELLLAQKLDVNARSKLGVTPLHVAAQKGSREIAELLLAHGAEVNVPDAQGMTALRWATDTKHPEVAELLRQHGGQDTRVDAKVSELQAGAYMMEWTSSGKMVLGSTSIRVTPEGGWEPLKSGGLSLDFSASFVEKRFAFTGDIREFIRSVVARENPRGKPEAVMSMRIVTAAHRDYNPEVPKTSPGLAQAGTVEVDANGFVAGGNAKSGWVNLPATLRYEENGSKVVVRLEGVSFWVASGGQDWLAFRVDRATANALGGAAGTSLPVETAIVHPASGGNGVAQLRLGERRFRVALANLTGKLEFVEEAAASGN
jgi:ankyrin repeat protein